jgi:hypothetical protein
MAISVRMGLAALGMAAAWSAAGADFDGSKALICAPVEALDCTAGAPCQKSIPDAIGAPAFVRIDFAKKIVIGTQRNTPIGLLEKSESELLAQGTELGYGWTIAVDAVSGRMSATLTDREGVFILFGACTPL